MHPDAPPLVAIPAGAIELRDARSGSSREVELLAFAIGRTPVTQGEYDAVLDHGAADAAGAADVADAAGAAIATGAAPGAGEIVRAADAPVHPVTWFDALRWCNAASVARGV